jgi:co-chaperonin GroES (HSP10)
MLAALTGARFAGAIVASAPHSIRPLRDRVLIRPIAYKHTTLFVAGIELRKGEVLAVGPGRRLKRRIPWRVPSDAPFVPGNTVNAGQTFFVEDGAETGAIAPMSVKVGDVVEYGFRDAFPVEFGGEKLLMIWQKNVYGTTDARTDSGILEPTSAPIDA